MNILVLNGNPDPTNRSFDEYMNRYQVKLHVMGHYVKVYQLRDMHFSGKDDFYGHSFQEESQIPSDDAHYILNSLQDASLLVIASPFQQGKISDVSDLIQTRLVSAYQNALKKEPNHWNDQAESFSMPLMGFILQTPSSMESQDLLLTRLRQERLALSCNSMLCFLTTLESGPSEAVRNTLQSADYRLNIESTSRALLSGLA